MASHQTVRVRRADDYRGRWSRERRQQWWHPRSRNDGTKGLEVATLRMIRSTGTACKVFARDVANGLLEVGHNGLALVGLLVLTVVVFVAGQTDLRHGAEGIVRGWLQERHEERAALEGNVLLAMAEPAAVMRATAADPRVLDRQQGAVAQWL